jgi:hypothetical protein
LGLCVLLIFRQALLKFRKPFLRGGHCVGDGIKIGRKDARLFRARPNRAAGESGTSQFVGDPGIERLGNAPALLFLGAPRLDWNLQQPAGQVKIGNEVGSNPRITGKVAFPKNGI